ncbi:DNA repair protein RAD51 homolog 2 isoform X1 [Nicotiana tomentosiformis]|uniref:DNA repair protein RAD51 homolog 2 isoform X1 n=1 Tax=Nicotiana tomentosiformis TaxID=4098 RepID=UPI00051B88BF|nr:DNA repair protein RAD51 homolog 2 isoform X1 [Nicotiana tomentosiformis]XP_016510286.1 PREDICTED: DNA repair protein RAD51 homolog 2-like isoform X1 [Nicotiana tabacum]XP_033517327.1 DNA repair protein RAD51 homolog 2 isoform X1 [Nicotiana tomentosiformis]
MANKLLSEMGLPKSIAYIFSARNLITAKDVLSLTEFELMELLDVDLAVVASAVAHISEITCPPYQTALSLLEQRVQNERMAGHLPTCLKGLDNALCGGIPFGVVTELVGPAGIGKTQFCLKLSLLASLPLSYGGLDGSVIYIDTESKFSSRRMIEMGYNSFPEAFHAEGMAQEMAGRILVLRPTSLSEFTDSLQKIRVSLFQHGVKLLIIDSMAALLAGEGVQGPQRQHSLGWHISFIKSVAEFSRIPVVVTNQVRSQSRDETSHYSFQAELSGPSTRFIPATYIFLQLKSPYYYSATSKLITFLMPLESYSTSSKLLLDKLWKLSLITFLSSCVASFGGEAVVEIHPVQSSFQLSSMKIQELSRVDRSEASTNLDSHLVAALGIHWAHAVSIRLVFESRSGQRFIKLAKSPLSPPLAFPFNITSSGISLLNDDGVEMPGPEIHTIHCQGHSSIINVGSEMMH